MNIGAERLASILAKSAKEGRELNIWRQFGALQQLSEPPVPERTCGCIRPAIEVISHACTITWRHIEACMRLIPGHMTMDVVGSAAFGVELRTQEAERGMNSEEAERLVWSAQTIFATGCTQPSASCTLHSPACSLQGSPSPGNNLQFDGEMRTWHRP